MKPSEISRRLCQIDEAKDDGSVGTLISKLIQSIAFVHHEHLVTKIHSRHLALDEYYKEMPEKVDCFAECAIAELYSLSYKTEIDDSGVESLLAGLKDDCSKVHAKLSEGGYSNLVNPLEDIQTFITSIQYKLALAG